MMDRNDALGALINVRATWPASMFEAQQAPDGDPGYDEDWFWHQRTVGDKAVILANDDFDFITRLEWSDARRQALGRPEQWPSDARILVQTNKGWWVFGTFPDATTTPTGGWEGIGEGHWIMWHQVQGRADLAGWDWRESLVHREDGKVAQQAEQEVTKEEEEAMREAEKRLAEEVAKQGPGPILLDPGRHYRKELRVRLTGHDIGRGLVVVKLDPYRICDLYRTGGGPREHLVKKGLRGEEKGQTERELVADLRAILDRWEEKLDEDEQVFV